MIFLSIKILFLFTDYKSTTTVTFLSEQQSINQSCSNVDLLTPNYKDTPISNTLRRKFIKRFNELTIAHNNGLPMTSEETQFLQIKDDSRHQYLELPIDQPAGCSTPKNHMTPINITPIKDIFPEASFHTPENQKYVYKVPDTEVYQTCLYVVPDQQNKVLMKRVSQKENFVEVVMPRNVPNCNNKPALYEISKKDANFIFSPKMKKSNNLNLIEEQDKVALNKWSKKIKHVYECGRQITNKIQEISDSSVIHLKKNLTFDDCDNILSRPKKRQKSEDFKLPGLPLSDIDVNIPRTDIRRKLNYSSDYSFEENSPPDSKTFIPISPCYNELGEAFMKPKSPRYEFKGFSKPVYSPNEFELRKKYAPHTLTSIKEENKLQVVPISPSVYMKENLNVAVEKMELDTKFPDLPTTPDIKFQPRLN